MKYFRTLLILFTAVLFMASCSVQAPATAPNARKSMEEMQRKADSLSHVRDKKDLGTAD